jgi:hypothetical protein
VIGIVLEDLKIPTESLTKPKVKAGIKIVKALKQVEIRIKEKTTIPQNKSQKEKDRIKRVLNMNLLIKQIVPNPKRIITKLRKKLVSVDLFQSFSVVNA